MSGELATLLTGRYVELKMLPLSFMEYVGSVDDNYPKYLLTLDDIVPTANYNGIE